MSTRLIVFEGPDAVGKSTLVEYSRRLLEAREISHEILSFPGDRPGTLGKLVYDLHHDSSRFGIRFISPVALQALHIAAHLDSINEIIVPAFRSNKWVVLDRFWWSTWLYGRAAGIDPRILNSLVQAEQLLWGQISPAVVFLLRRTRPFGDERSNKEFTTHSDLYREIAHSEAAHYEIITIADAELHAASQIVEQWVDKQHM
jgi:dTMP kinase